MRSWPSLIKSLADSLQRLWAEECTLDQRTGPEVVGITCHDLAVDDGGPDRQLAKHPAQQRKAPAEPRRTATVEFHLIAEFVDLDTKAVEFDLVTVPLDV